MQRKRRLFKTWANDWLALMKPTVKGNTFLSGYENPVRKHLIPHFQGLKLTEIRQADIQAYINLKAENYSLDTLKKHRIRLFEIFDSAIDNGLCAKNPVRKLKIPKTKARTEKAIYTAEQVQKIFNFGYMHRFGAEIQFMLATGVSRGELLALRWGDVNFERRVVFIRRAVALVPNAKTGKQETHVGEPKTEYRRRDIPVDSEICRILNETSRNSIYVFCNIKGEVNNPRTWSRRHYDVFMSDMREYYGSRGVEIPVYPPHQLRHTRLSLWINEGKSPLAVAKVAGHADTDMLHRHYAHSSVDELRELLGIY